MGHPINVSDQEYLPDKCNRILEFEPKDESGKSAFLEFFAVLTTI